MKKLTRLSVLPVLCVFLLCANTLAAAPQQDRSSPPPDRSSAYYHYALGHTYQQLAVEQMNREYLRRAVDEFQKAIEADPGSSFLKQELIRLYASANQLDDAVAEADKLLKEDPNNVEVLELMGRIYSQYAFGRRGQVNEELLKSAIRQYEKILEIDPQDTDSLLRLAHLYRSAQDNEKAERALEKLLELKPDDTDAMASLALLYDAAGDTEKAIETLEKVKAGGSADRNHLTALAAAYERAGEFAKAAEIYQDLLERGEDPIAVRRGLAHNLVLSGQYGKALEQYKILIEADPGNAEIHLRLSQIYREQQRFSEARDSLRRAAELAPDSLEIKYNVVQLLEAEGKTAEAIESLRELLAATEKDAYNDREKRNRSMFLEQLGMLYRQDGNFEEAEKAFRAMAEVDEEAKARAALHTIDTYRAAREHDKALEVAKSAFKEFSDDRRLATLYASVLAETGDAEKGAKTLRGLLDGSPRDHQTYLSLAQVYEKGKKYDKAIEAVKKAQEISKSKPQMLTALFTHGSVLERAKRFEEAEEKFRELLNEDPNNASALNYLGYMLADRNVQLDDAHDLIQKALDLDPGNGAYLDSLGWVYYRQDKLELAERYLLRSLEKYKHDPTVLSHLGDVYFKLGKDAEAKEHWERSLREWQRSAPSDRDPAEIAKLRKKLADLQTKLSSAAGADKKDQ